MTKTKIQKTYTDHGLGFPVQILNAPMRKIRGEWVLDIDFNEYRIVVLKTLVEKSSKLTGNEVKFIRHHFEMTLKAFAKRFGGGSHVSVLKWENTGDSFTSMAWSTEKDIRMAIAAEIAPKTLQKVYEGLVEAATKKKENVKVDSERFQAAI